VLCCGWHAGAVNGTMNEWQEPGQQQQSGKHRRVYNEHNIGVPVCVSVYLCERRLLFLPFGILHSTRIRNRNKHKRYTPHYRVPQVLITNSRREKKEK